LCYFQCIDKHRNDQENRIRRRRTNPRVMSATCGVIRLIDDHKRCACLNIFNEVLKSWLHSATENFASSIGQIFVHIHPNVIENQHHFFMASMEWISESTTSFSPIDDACVGTDVFNAIQRFNSFLDCNCTVVNGDSSESKVVLQAQGISGTLFEKGN
jgi:hypothetical protein